MVEERRGDKEEGLARDALSGFDAEELIDDPDDLVSDERREHEPAPMNPDSPDPA